MRARPLYTTRKKLEELPPLLNPDAERERQASIIRTKLQQLEERRSLLEGVQL